ncbi:YggS family pyridoxal phosphate-dependent enzyme [Allorhizocola rhizosphaerae]|uniref:YggS family pyridoxal phosphate-dependent enzyme n=1 Tax=Allorhizocola rhizosphaerae TaxID=1872709 RepID=UPI000E3C297B|nr:YggS family pyridoxal phosphate-dependent enzyme [Allorhizocola rhizosphaerae]
MDRRDELAANLAAVRERIAAACIAVGRSPSEVTLIAVTKTYPASDAAHLVALGVPDIGENRDQEAAPKAAAVPGARWHFIGQLQRNKAKSVVTYAHMVHSVDSVLLARTLAEQASRRREAPLEALVQVSLDEAPGRGGAAADEFLTVAEAIAGSGALRLKGIMAVAPLGEDAQMAFARLERYITLLRADHPDATVVSAGMSDDLVEAIANGATHVRIGSALLGKRQALR